MTLGSIGGGPVRVSSIATVDNGILPQPSIEFVTDDATYGTYISRLSYNGIVWNFGACSMFGVGLWNVAAATAVELSNQEWTPTITTDSLGVITIELTLANYTGISFTITMTPMIEGYEIGIVATNTSSTHATEWFEFPRYACRPPSGDTNNSYLAHGFCGGLVLKNPHLATLNTFTFALEAPPNMQYFSYYDASTREHLYVSTDDDDGWRKRWDITGDQTDTTVIGVKHYFPNPRRVHNGSGVMPYTVPYSVMMEAFKGRTADGRCGCYDAAIRYRKWATDSARPWMANGPWMDDANVSSRVKNSDLYYVRLKHSTATSPTEWTTIVQDMSRLKTFIGADNMLGLLYGWGANMNFQSGGFYPPAFTPLAQVANLNTALGTAASADIHLSYYTIPQWWEDGLVGVGFAPWRFDDFIARIDYNSIHQFIIRDHNDLAITSFQLHDDVFDPLPPFEEGDP